MKNKSNWQNTLTIIRTRRGTSGNPWIEELQNASLCNKDIQVIYTSVYLGWNLQDQIILAIFLCLLSSCVSEVFESKRSWSCTAWKWLRLTLRSPIDSLIFSLQLGHLFFRWCYFLLVDVSGWRMKQPMGDSPRWKLASTCSHWKFLLRMAVQRKTVLKERR